MSDDEYEQFLFQGLADEEQQQQQQQQQQGQPFRGIDSAGLFGGGGRALGEDPPYGNEHLMNMEKQQQVQSSGEEPGFWSKFASTFGIGEQPNTTSGKLAQQARREQFFKGLKELTSAYKPSGDGSVQFPGSPYSGPGIGPSIGPGQEGLMALMRAISSRGGR